MQEFIFALAWWSYPLLGFVNGFWGILLLGGMNTLTSERMRNRNSVTPGWILGVFFLFNSAAFFLLFQATRGLPINNNSYSFIIRMLWAGAGLTGVVSSAWHFAKIAADQWRTRQKRGPVDG